MMKPSLQVESIAHALKQALTYHWYNILPLTATDLLLQ